jgi:hypothetical protein
MDPPLSFTRRDLLANASGGLCGIAFAHVLAREGLGSSGRRDDGLVGLHHPAKAKQVIQLFMNGGASQMDLFDYKPELEKLHGQKFDPGTSERVEAATSEAGAVLASPFKFQQHGESGRWVSDQLPHLAKQVDKLAFLMGMTSRTNVHGPASFLMNTGFLFPGFPSMGAWISYALGNLTDNLPTFVVLPDSRGLPYNQRGNFSAGFLPVMHQGTIVRANALQPLPDLAPPVSAEFISAESTRDGLSLLEKFNTRHLTAHPGDSRLTARVRAYELAAKLQVSAPQVFDLSDETAATRARYGLDNPVTEDFGRRCLLARRMVERGVRFVQVWSGANGPTGNWDNHASIIKELPPIAASIDQPMAALLEDLQQRGMLDETLVLWNTEFGRMPFSQSSEGRDHNGGAFSGWMAGAGVKPGVAFGQTDPWGWRAVENITTTYDFHATVLHLLGIDHQRLTVRHDGSDRRLTDVHGQVIREVLS